MKRPEFTYEQEEWLCYALDEWYLTWKSKMTKNGAPHMLGIAKEQFKSVLCGEEPNRLIENLVSDQPE